MMTTTRSPAAAARAAVFLALFAVLSTGAAAAARAQDANFSNWPEGKSPKEIGERVAKRFLEVPWQLHGMKPEPKIVNYPEVCAWYGSLTFAKATNDTALRDKLIERFQPLWGEKKSRIPVPNHVDYTVFAAVPLEIYLQTREQRYLDLGKEMADRQWGEPFGQHATTQGTELAKKGYTWQTRLWIDDMYMITMAQAQAYRATGDRKYIDRAAREMVLYLDELQRPNGLFFHAPDVPFFWARGNGWMAAGMSELLRSLPQDNADRPRIVKGYKLMMESLLKYQDADGMWHQLIDAPESFAETSGTGMFTFAFIEGVKHGWLEESTYGPAARKGWLALTTYLEPNGDIRDVCEGTNKKNDREFYLTRKRLTGDMHGQAPVLWSATALLRNETATDPAKPASDK
jgi:rhamnogalacturonyl hydrolase YesR